MLQEERGMRVAGGAIREDDQPTYDCMIDISGLRMIVFTFGEEGELSIATEAVREADLVLIRQCAFLMLRFSEPCIRHNGSPATDGDLMEPGEFFQLAHFHFYYRDPYLWTENREDLIITGMPYENLPDRGLYPAFQRNTRIQLPVDETPIELLDPSPMPGRPEERLALKLLPSLGMLAASGLMAARGGTAMLLFSGISAITGVVTAIAGVFRGSRDYRNALKEREAVYSRYMEEKKREIQQARQREGLLMRSQYPGTEELIKRLFRFSPDLFDRNRNDPDFLHLRIGTGTIKARKELHYREQEQLEEQDALQQLPERTAAEFEWLEHMPVICDLKETAILGVTGKEADRYALLKNVILDIALRQYHSDVQLLLLSDEAHAERLHWLRMIPHVVQGPGKPRGIAIDKESRAAVLEYLYRELATRKETEGDDTHLVVCFYHDAGFLEHPVSRFLTLGKELGVSFLFFADRREQLVPGCCKVIDIQNGNYAAIVDTQNGRNRTFFTFPTISDQEAAGAASLLAPVYTREVSLDHTLATDYSLYQMLGIHKASELDLKKRWRNRSAGHSLCAPLGISGTGVIDLDIHDKAHGPHGLVAGTTGSGKSELLQTYMLSMAVRYSPEEVSFVIIDYKGGGLAGPLHSLPHLRGTITNMDEKEASRALRSVKGELLRRQRLFEKAHVNHIDQYVTGHPLPHLIMIIDEFAEMKAAHPEFMKELISAARIGRSLGVHLILATQKPSGQVSDQIWSNSRFRICLKVQEASDSNEMLRSPLAAEIREPGRGYLQVGNQEIFELFQSAYSSCPEDEVPGARKEFSIFQVTDTGRKTLVYHRAPERAASSMTQMQAIVRHIEQFCREQGISKLPDLFSPPLERDIPYPGPQENVEGTLKACLGWYDDPDHQRRCLYTPDLSGGHLLVIGSAGSGKTCLLRLLIRELAEHNSPEELHIYIVDCASRVLKGMEELPHVGGVAVPYEEEKLDHLFRMLERELELRKRVLESTGFSTLKAARTEGRTNLPEILLVVDQLAALKEVYFQEREELRTLCQEGLSAGIHVVAASPQASTLGYRYLSLFAERIGLFCSDQGEYRYLFDRVTEFPEEIPGRCILERGKGMHLCQIYRIPEEDLRRFLQSFRAEYGVRARAIPMIPEHLTVMEMESFAEDAHWTEFCIPVGLDREMICPIWLDLARTGVLYLSGREQGGRHNWTSFLVHELEAHYPDRYRIYAADGFDRRLQWLKDSAEQYVLSPEQAVTMLLTVEEQLQKRHQEAYQEAAAMGTWPLLLLLLDSSDALEAIDADPEAREAWKNLTGRYKHLRVCTVILCAENAPVSYSAPEPLRLLREQGACLFFGELKYFRLFELPYSVSGRTQEIFRPGDAWLLRGPERICLRTPFLKTS